MTKDFLKKQVTDHSDELIKEIQDGLLVKFAHQGFSDFVQRTIQDMKEEIILQIDENELSEKAFRSIASDLQAIFNDSKNLLILRPLNERIIIFFKKYYLLIQNWNSIRENENIEENILALKKLLEIERNLADLSERAFFVLREMEDAINRSKQTNGANYRSSQTFMEAISKSVKKSQP